MTNIVNTMDINERNQKERYCTDDRASEERYCEKTGIGAACAVIDRALAESEPESQVNVAIDGACGSGKSTLGAALAERYECNLFHMDDFFLRPHQRTPGRYAQPGGNVDYERFRAEVLERLADREGFVYRRFDCRTMALGEPCAVPYRRLNIIEGAYSCHPYFGGAYRVRFFLEIPFEERKERIIARSGVQMYERFEKEWIPMENRYFNVFGIREQCVLLDGVT